MNSFKSIYSLFVLLFLFSIVGCDFGAANKTEAKTTTSSEPAPKEEVTNEIPIMDVTGIDYAILAKELCPCTTTTSSLITQLKELDRVAEKAKFDKLNQKVSEGIKTAVKCTEDKKKSLTSRQVDKKLILDALKSNCEGIAPSLLIQVLLRINIGDDS